MNAERKPMHRSFFALLPALLALVMCGNLARGQAMSATYAKDSLSLTIPYHADHAGAGRLVVELLSPEDKVLGTAERVVDVESGSGVWKQEIAAAEPLPFDQLIWQRVRYGFRYSGAASDAFTEVRSVSTILRRPVVRVLGQRSYLAGAQAAMRVIVMDAAGKEIPGANTVRIELMVPERSPEVLFDGKLNARGTTETVFRFPAGLVGDYNLHFVVETAIGSVESTQSVRLEEKVSLLLTTEKPIYQPAQTIHVRALALNRADHIAAAGRKISFELEDSRGNKVFRKATTTDAFGIASAEFALADEVNLGAYHLRSRIGDEANDVESSANTAELRLQVQRYVLPKFRVAIEFAKQDDKPKRDYRPGDHVRGTVHANYFFGKPVDGAAISIKASGMDAGVFAAGAAEGRTDREGDYHFDLTLPTYFAGRPLHQGAAPVLLEATVKDSAGHAETRGEPITVSQSSLLVTAVPEGGKLVPGLQNQVFVLASYPDGTPAQAELNVRYGDAAERKVETDKGGIAVVQIMPAQRNEPLHVEADDRRGHRVTSNVALQARTGDEQILLRTDMAVYKPGGRIQISVLSTQQRGTAYVDLVKDGQTFLTRDVDLVNGRAELSVQATPGMSGTLDVDAYMFGRNAQAVADHRLVFIQPADELRIEAVADAGSYLPGADARVRFHVTDKRGRGVSAALGIEVVDEAVFALAEKQPGFAKVFFYLEQELLKPRYEIHSLSSSDIVQSSDDPHGEEAEQHERSARVLFSAAETVNPHTLDAEIGRTLPQGSEAEYEQRYRDAFVDYVRELAAKLTVRKPEHKAEDLRRSFAALIDDNGAKPHDAWGGELRMEPVGWPQVHESYYQVRSAGPDGQFDTSDDLSVTLEERSGMVYPPSGRGSMTLRMEHDRGPLNGLAEITGAVTDATGAVIPRATVTLRAVNGGSVRKAITDASGLFTLSGLSPGAYRLTIQSIGFEELARSIKLEARDRAVLTSVLSVGSVNATVTVEAAPVMTFAAPMGREVEQVRMGAVADLDMVMANGLPAGISAGAMKKSLAAGGSAATPEAHVRSYFPEALYINPEVLTDGNGNANITIPMADSITTWRMAMFASTKAGALGTGASSLKVFQDFFVDLDLPVTLTQGDRVSIPVAIYNYAAKRGKVSLTLTPEDWFSLVDDHAEKSVEVDAGQVGGSQFTLEAKRIGKFKLTLSASMNGGDQKDVIVREIEVVPNGSPQDVVFNGRLDSSVQQTVAFPADAIPDASKIFVRLYPGPLSQIIEGMDGILRMPGGCFEQTSSSTYPNVLALDYMKRTKKLTPEVHAKAEGYIANGYQRLLTFEVPGGGFSWFGQAPANKILTAYGLMEFHDMASVYDVDPRLIERTRDWLVAQQQPDGSWKPDTQFINEGATDRFNSDVLRITAYIAWSLEVAGYQGPAIVNARSFLARQLGERSDAKLDAYTLAVLANFAVDGERGEDKDTDFARRSLRMLLDARSEQGDQAWWGAVETGVYSTGMSANIETTGLAVQALLKSGQSPEVARKALAWIVAKKGASGNWGTTQATIMSLRALLLASEHGSGDAHGTVEVLLDGKSVETLTLTPENNDLLFQYVLPGVQAGAANHVELRFQGSGGMAYQIAGRYFIPWQAAPVNEPLSIDVAYDRTKLAQDDLVSATATIRSHIDKTANMVMVDLGIPPGFDLLTEDLQSLVEKTAEAKSGRLEKFSLTATQAILYFNSLAPKDSVLVHFRLRAKYPIRAKNFVSRAYEYYDPSVTASARPVQFEVTSR